MRVLEEIGLTDEAEWAFVLTMSHESGQKYGWGNAFNQGGADNGYTAINPGDSSKDLDQEILTMSLGEIKRRMALPKNDPQALFATGGTQFIPSTFIETQRRLGLPDDTIFDYKTQAEFFYERGKQRVSWGGGTQGLINEWRGLKYASEEERQRLLEFFQNSAGIYQNPRNTLPGLKYN